MSKDQRFVKEGGKWFWCPNCTGATRRQPKAESAICTCTGYERPSSMLLLDVTDGRVRCTRRPAGFVRQDEPKGLAA